jgi:RNA polymerase sigma-70 factor (ECF subfamily)
MGRKGESTVDVDVLFERFYPGLFRYCHRLTGDPDLAADVAQEAFVRLWEREVRGDPLELRGWLFKVATHRVRDVVRVSENRRRLLAENPVRPSAPPTPDRLAEQAETSRRVRRALDTLPARDRELLLMREEGFSYKEMAEAVGVAAGSVGTLLARALRRFASEIEMDDDGSKP